VISMLLLSVVLVFLVFLAVMLVAGNNLSACVGPAIGSRIVTKRFGVLVGATGFSAGLLVQGSAMVNSVSTLLPNASSVLRAEALLVAIIIFLIAFKIRVPMSLSMALVGLFAGLSVAGKSLANGLYVGEVVLTWILVPLIAFGLAFGLIRILNKAWPANLWHRLQAYKLLIIVASFTTAYVTGANTLGMIVAAGGFDIATVLAAVAAIFVGSVFLSEGPIKRVSEEFFLMRYANAAVTLVTSTVLVEIATIFKIPLSITQTTSIAVLGTGLSYKTRLVSAKPFLKIVAGWVIAPLLSFAIGLVIG
jgi:inorganic phosphate transporter, PiT family